MKRFTLGLLVAMAIGGCIDDNGRGYGRGYFPATCQKFVTCDGCTRALGCGWCQSGVDGLCASSPNECANATTFSWTWEPTGCSGATSDGGVDYGTPVEPSTDGGIDVHPEASADVPASVDVPPAIDAAAE